MSADVEIVHTEDDDDDFQLSLMAFQEAGLKAPVRRMRDGEELMDYLRRGRFSAGARPPSPVVLLDLHLPKKSGWEALREIKSDAALRRVPVVVLTTSPGEEDVSRAYDLGCNTFIRKPMGLDDYLELARAIDFYWVRVAALPRVEAPGAV